MVISYLNLTIILLKSAVVLGLVMGLAAMCIWFERKVSALIQDRIGANRAKIFGFDLAGVFNTLVADPIKAVTKEDFLPTGTSQFMHSLAPFLALVPVLLSFAVIPLGPNLNLGDFAGGGNDTIVSLQLADINIGFLYIFAMGSLAVYGSVLAGWVSNNKFSLLGGIRSSAQMISYEVTMGISILGLIAMYGTLDLNKIIASQAGLAYGFLPNWGIFQCFPLNIIAFVVFFTSLMAETKRAPFDLPESESELVAGYLTEYSGMKFLLFWFGEFAEIAVASAVATVLFFGGWQVPYLDISTMDYGWLIGLVAFLTKVILFCVLQIIIRWTLPRFRYDQLMKLCWKIMLPVSIVNSLLTIVLLLGKVF